MAFCFGLLGLQRERLASRERASRCDITSASVLRQRGRINLHLQGPTSSELTAQPGLGKHRTHRPIVICSVPALCSSLLTY
ncbi:hypothetical protein GDO81_025032 [Engystomops pustulosus]|uniref:Uncharacterized protein n=1 Tax=Engystomops pustulosus TaxID=76066 RepID=A0AAV6YSZ8_ENGPU|nr:hypothetical protein GDO81_025032 [Engystomops pustulosus]